MWQFKKKCPPIPKHPNKITGVCLGWDLKPHIGFEDGTYFPTKIERMIYPEYFAKGDWPHDPITGEKMKIQPLS